jgi:DNA polymerase-4
LVDKSISGELECSILHVDMDAFFAAVELLDHPELRGKPVLVGGSGARGVVAACTYEARAFGIRSGMSSVEARHRCPEAVFLQGRFDRYREVSAAFHVLLEAFTPLVEGIALDEAFLDVAGAQRLFGPPRDIGEAIRRAAREQLGLECAVGIGRSKLIAKLASRAAKPVVTPAGPQPGPGVVCITPQEELAFLSPLPVRSLWGVGPASARRLEQLGVRTVADLAAVPEVTLRRRLGMAAGRQLAALARGEDPRRVVANAPHKSIGHEETFPVDLFPGAELHRHLLRLADAVISRLRDADLAARTLTVKVRTADRALHTRSATPNEPIRTTREILDIATVLLDEIELSRPVRLLGLSLSGLRAQKDAEAEPLQLTFLGLPGDPAGPVGEHERPEESGSSASRATWEEVEGAIGAVRARYGSRAVGSTALIGSGGLGVKRQGDTQWGPPASTEEDRTS